ncbi:MAG: hypothetical protein ACE5F1_14420 [Planctomycetota bacterium]
MNTSTKFCSLALLPLIGASLQAAPHIERRPTPACSGHSIGIQYMTELQGGTLQGVIEIHQGKASPGSLAFLVVGPGSFPIPLPGGDSLCVTPEHLIPLGPMETGSARLEVPANLFGTFYMQALAVNFAGALEFYTSEPMLLDNDHGNEVDGQKIDAGNEVDGQKIDAGNEVDTQKIDASNEVDTQKIDASNEIDTQKLDSGGQVAGEPNDASQADGEPGGTADGSLDGAQR